MRSNKSAGSSESPKRIAFDGYALTKINELQQENVRLKEALNKQSNLPEGCVPGPWCDLCDFEIIRYQNGDPLDSIKICGFGKCKNLSMHLNK